MPEIRIGTSGWSYNHWRDIFYPKDLAQAKWLEFYAKIFDTVEINSSFYHLPKPKTFSNWRARTPKNFLFSVKASRFITHVKKLKDVKEPWKRFINSAKELKERLGPILFQLSPNLKANIEKLENFISILPSKYRYTFEFRNESWFNKKIYEILEKNNISLCFADTPSYPYKEILTADFVYIRLHGHKKLYGSKYTNRELKIWANKIKKWMKEKKDVYVYFDNDACGYAVENAKTLLRML